MATATTVKLSTADTGVFSAGVRADSAEVASEVLQDDLQKHHIYFNQEGFHSMSSGSAGLE
jgi:UDP-N-acetyl-D-mannosaminuronic acid transferase (WecB/TagA/CpsF family)